MTEEHLTEETRPEGTVPEDRPKAPVAAMVAIGAVATALGIALGLIIEWFPEQGSTQAEKVDTTWDVLIFASVPVFVLVTTIVLFAVRTFRMRPGEEELDGPPIHGNTKLEVIWTALPAIALVALCTYAYIVLTDLEESQANEMRVNVTGQQFTWTFEYPEEGGGTPVRSQQLYLPVDRPVRFHVESLDVIHDFWVPAFRMKVDAVPGITTRYRITPAREGRYPVVCAELCGPGHAFMRQSANVVPPGQFQAWVRRQRSPDQSGGRNTGGRRGTSATIDGRKLFLEGNQDAPACGACHVLADAGTTTTAGPNLDRALAGLTSDQIARFIVDPRGARRNVMPTNYGDTLSKQELKALSDYLDEVTD